MAPKKKNFKVLNSVRQLKSIKVDDKRAEYTPSEKWVQLNQSFHAPISPFRFRNQPRNLKEEVKNETDKVLDVLLRLLTRNQN